MSVFADIESANALVIGASQGIGLGWVKHLLKDDRFGKIYGIYRNPDTASDLLALEQEYPQRVTTLIADVTDEGQIAQAVSRISTDAKKLHFVIYCVGLLHEGELQPEKRLQQLNSDHLIRYFQVNSIGAALFAKYLVPMLKHRNRTVFASISAKVGSIGDNYLGGWYGYRASKAALNMYMHTVAIEYKRKAPQTIVVCLHPGTTDTRLSSPFQKNVPPGKLFPVEKTVSQLMTVVENLTEADSGQFFSWDGSPLPW
jgi:NAD(P)-dependent dehydrogenase (short-subunit alcohol dehydrogenase family)